MTNKRNEKRIKKEGDGSYFAVSRRKTRKNMMKILSIGAAVIVAFIAMVIVTGASITSHTNKSLVTHIHPVLKNIGIDSSLHKDQSLDQYGTEGVGPLHTHDDSGTIHVESIVNRNYTLGEFLNIWGIDLNGKTVKVTVDDGIPRSDYRNYVLEDGQNLHLYVT